MRGYLGGMTIDLPPKIDMRIGKKKRDTNVWLSSAHNSGQKNWPTKFENQQCSHVEYNSKNDFERSLICVTCSPT